jgi:MoaA/NifB/PqqE/SkfB family radical SAM enzyme
MTSPLSELINHVVTGSPVKDLQLDGSKIGWYRDRVEAWKRGEKIAPVTMDVSWTRKCQASCSFCYAQLQASTGGEITKEIAFEFLEDAAAIGVRGVSLISDGESTLVPFYEESIEYGASLGLKVGVGTNGIAMEKERLQRILPHISYLRFNFSAGERKRYAEIMGVKQTFYDRVLQNIRDAMEIKRRDGLGVIVNMQLVLQPQDGDQILPFARLCREIRPDYGIIKHTADSIDKQLGVDYTQYKTLYDVFREAEAMGDDTLRIVVKWSRIVDEGKRDYTRCYGPEFLLQMSGNGLIAPCGLLFNERYRAFHIGWITGPERQRFRDIWASKRYDEVMKYLASDLFGPHIRCGSNCLQHNTNKFLFDHLHRGVPLHDMAAPPHMEFL